MEDQQERFTQASQLPGLAEIPDHHPPPSVDDQLCRDRVVVLLCDLQLSTGYIGLEVSWVVQAKVSPHLCFARGILPEL